MNSLLNTLIVSWTNNVSDIDYYIVSYAINAQPHTEQYISVDRDHFTIVMVVNDTQYTIGVAAVVTVNGDNIIGPWTNKSGTHIPCISIYYGLKFTAIIGKCSR